MGGEPTSVNGVLGSSVSVRSGVINKDAGDMRRWLDLGEILDRCEKALDPSERDWDKAPVECEHGRSKGPLCCDALGDCLALSVGEGL